ncbi:MAG: hypothetical protein MI745_09525 [Pseudomonadales bacterium]|nr:hypothetical protein [Pseudomonadales bacterium]
MVVGWLVACSSTHNTQVTSSARVKGHEQGDHVNKVLVIALVDDAAIRNALEARVVTELEGRKVEAAASLPVLGENYGEGKDHKQMAADIASRGYESALVISLINVKEEMHYTQGGTNYAPDIAVQGGFGQTYYVRQNAVYEPGYFSNEKKYFLESNLYRLQPETLLWSAKSTTVNPADLEAGTAGVAEAVVERMAGDDMI